MPINYTNTKIYKIYSHLGDKIYIGATTKQYLSQRMTAHRTKYKQWKKGKIKYTPARSYVLFEEYGIQNCIIELLEAKECTDINEQAKLEGGYIQALKCVNNNVPGRKHKESDKAYYEKNKEKKKAYYEKNKERIKERNAKNKALKLKQ